MASVAKVLMVLSLLGFILAVISNLFEGPMWGTTAEGFSRGSTNLALIAIGISLIFSKTHPTSCG